LLTDAVMLSCVFSALPNAVPMAPMATPAACTYGFCEAFIPDDAVFMPVWSVFSVSNVVRAGRLTPFSVLNDVLRRVPIVLVSAYWVLLNRVGSAGCGGV
jgi:hypothetical protein